MYNCWHYCLDLGGPHNWTSELRQKIPGFTLYTGKLVVDFTYPDYNGALTALVYGNDQRELEGSMAHILLGSKDNIRYPW